MMIPLLLFDIGGIARLESMAHFPTGQMTRSNGVKPRLHIGITSAYIEQMAAPSPDRTFGDVGREGFEVEVVCQKCGHQAMIDISSPGIRDQRISGRRYRCSQPGCRGIGACHRSPRSNG
jgi:hypothetical protein